MALDPSQLFAKSCDGSKATLRPNHRNIWTCDDCETIRSIQGTKICQVIKTRAFKITKAIEFTKKSEITPSELREMEGFKKSSDNTYSAAGLEAAGAGKITKLQQQLLIQNQKNQTPIFAFFTQEKKKKNDDASTTSPSATFPSIASAATSNTNRYEGILRDY